MFLNVLILQNLGLTWRIASVGKNSEHSSGFTQGKNFERTCRRVPHILWFLSTTYSATAEEINARIMSSSFVFMESIFEITTAMLHFLVYEEDSSVI